MSNAYLSFLIVKFQGHHDPCGFVDHCEFVRWLLTSVLLWVNSVIAWLAIQGEKGGPALVCSLSLSILIDFRWDHILHWLWKISGRSDSLASLKPLVM